MGKEKNTGKRPNRIAALITYVIALVCLLLGLFLPFGNGAENTVGNMLGLQIPAAINSLYPLEFLKNIAEKYPFAYNFPVSFGGKFTLDFGAILVLLYALVTLMGVVALIPVIANAVSKKAKKNVALRAASFIEVLAVAVLSVLFFFIIPHAVVLGEGVKALNNWSLIAALGGTLLMLIVQAFIYKKGSGAVKFVLALLSVVTVVTSLYGVTAFLPFLDGKLPAVGNFAYGLYGIGESAAQAYYHIPMLFAGLIRFDLGLDIKLVILMLAGAVIYYVVLANLVFDLMGLGKKTNRAMLVLNIVRYLIAIIVAAAIIILAAITDGVNIGLMSIVIAVLALIALVINIIRLATFKAHKKAKKSAKAKPEAAAVANEPAKETKKERKEREKAEKLAAKQAEREAEEAAKAQREAERAQAQAEKEAAKAAKAETVAAYAQPVDDENDLDNPAFYRPVIYKGPVDEFIRLLNNEEKVEFAKVFIERQCGPLTGVPDYVIGGDNSKFFASVFIYFAKIRDLISDGLMNAIYKQANVMR